MHAVYPVSLRVAPPDPSDFVCAREEAVCRAGYTDGTVLHITVSSAASRFAPEAVLGMEGKLLCMQGTPGPDLIIPQSSAGYQVVFGRGGEDYYHLDRSLPTVLHFSMCQTKGRVFIEHFDPTMHKIALFCSKHILKDHLEMQVDSTILQVHMTTDCPQLGLPLSDDEAAFCHTITSMSGMHTALRMSFDVEGDGVERSFHFVDYTGEMSDIAFLWDVPYACNTDIWTIEA